VLWCRVPAFIKILTQLCTALILVGPNPVGIMVSVAVLLLPIHSTPPLTHSIHERVKKRRAHIMPSLTPFYHPPTHPPQETWRMLKALRITMAAVSSLASQNLQQAIITGLCASCL
jgi:hypothetical protein